MWAQGVGHGMHDLRPQPNPASTMVCRGLVHNQSETRSKRTRASAVTGTWKLSNSMDDLAEAAHGHGSSRARSSVGPVEVDESYVGGVAQGVRGRGADCKFIVAIAIEV